MKEDFKIQRCITYYEKNGDIFIDERCILENELSLIDLKELFNNDEDDPYLYKQYTITEHISKSINAKVNIDFDFGKYDYFLETFTITKDNEADQGVRLKNR